MSSLLNTLRSISRAERVTALEYRSRGSLRKPDFEGVVYGSWAGLNPLSAGLVSYKGKTYKTKMLGFTSLPKGARVQLSYVDGIYYSSW